MSEAARAAITPFGDSALLVRLGDSIDPAVNDRVHALAAALHASPAMRAGWLGTPVAAYASLLVPFDALAVNRERVAAVLGEVVAAAAVAPPRDPALDQAAGPIEISVRYGGPAGPDLGDVARRTGMTPAEVVSAHCSVDYRVYMLGFAPGFGYLGALPAALEVPRRETPRARVAAGSVAIAGRQTAVYPQATPGGWHLIGRTDALLWDPRRAEPATLRPGRRVRFVPA